MVRESPLGRKGTVARVSDDPHAIVCAGDPRHPDHGAFLSELGRTTYMAARVAGISFDILRVFDRVPSADMYEDALGRLCRRVEDLSERRPELPGLAEFIVSLGIARVTRNDLLHALPVKDGLHRRISGANAYIRTFYTVEDLRNATRELENAWRLGSQLLYHDDGAAVRAWYEAGGT
jgi:hypothetical protein